MSDQKYLKITFHVGSSDKSKINAYLKMPSPVFAILLREIQMCIFEQHNQPKTELRTYWIDEDGDEIEVVNQCDYEIFMAKRSERRHLQVAPLITATQKDSAAKNATDSENAHPNAKSVHARIECDGCKMGPIIGFRYKCIQCPNFDLCEKCEMNHQHPEHMMVRMPNQNSPDVIETWITGRGNSRRHHKYSANGPGTCPFSFSADVSSPGANCRTPKSGSGDGSKTPSDGTKEHHHGRHGRKHQRRNIQNNIFTHLYNMMQDLAEGGGPSLNEDLDNDVKNAAAAAATEAATKAATAAAASASAAASAHAATQAAFNFTAETSSQETPKNTGTKPKTPPPTPNVTNNEPEFKQTQQTTNNTATPKDTAENKENVTNTTQTTPILNSPILENVAQFVDPQYMKAGIQILNNFSEMFAKMLDPVEGENDGGVGAQYPFPAAAFAQQRKNSASSTASSTKTNSTSTNSSSTQDKGPQTQTQTQTQTVAAAADSLDAEGAVGGKETTNDAVLTAGSEKNSKEQTPEHSRSQSEETDWQIIDQQNLIATPVESLVDITPPAAETPKTPITAPNVHTINYVQLSKDLQAHINQEKEKEAASAVTPSSASASVSAPPAPVSSTATPPSTAPIEKPLYHLNLRIHDSVVALMEMGFSNEQNILAQLLESVNGNIHEALEMLTASRN